MSRVLLEFGERVREIRTNLGVSQERLADVAGLDRTFVSKVERGKSNLSLLNIARLAKALKVPIGALFPIPDTKK